MASTTDVPQNTNPNVMVSGKHILDSKKMAYVNLWLIQMPSELYGTNTQGHVETPTQQGTYIHVRLLGGLN